MSQEAERADGGRGGRVVEIVRAAREFPPAAREAFLDAACGADAALRARVERLLADEGSSAANADATMRGEAETSGLFQTSGSPNQDFTTRRDARPAEIIGTWIGPYKLLQKLGEGGMGIVYLAEQEEPVARRVALKIIKAGMDTTLVIGRFEQERQALAVMDHPHIAKVLDAGATNAGRPYFVMELVKGIPITQFCDQERLSPRQRLELFLPICQAVQHAHQKGIIHRDLKPSNVLVSLVDGRPVPKVIDFGVAKATHHKLTERTMLTEVGSIVGTLEYMAPEQAELNNLDIDTRADIYSLGVLLYELLTGTPPFTPDQLRKAAFTEMMRLIREVEPLRPSTRLSSSDALPSIAACRRVEPRKLKSLVTGELDWIVMKCLEKERQRRYDTANGLLQDLQRYLADEPVLAGPPSVRYRARKFLRRNRGPVAAAAVCVLLLVGGIIGTTWGLVRAEHAQLRAEQEADEAKVARIKTRAALDEVSSEAMETLLSQQPELTDRHKAFLRRALELYGEFANDPTSDPQTRAEVAQAHLRMGNIRFTLGEMAEAEIAFGRAVSLWDSLHAEFPVTATYVSDLAGAYDLLGRTFDLQGKRDPAAQQYQMSADLLTMLHIGEPNNAAYASDLARSLTSVANSQADRAERKLAEDTYNEAIRLLESIAPPQATLQVRNRLGTAYYNLAIVLDEQGRLEDSETAYGHSIDVYATLAAEFPRNHDVLRRQSNSLINLSGLLARRQAWDRADELCGQGLAIQEQLVHDYPAIPEYQKFLGRTLSTQGDLLAERGDHEEAARAAYERSLEVKQQLAKRYPCSPEYERDVASTCNNRAFFEFNCGNLEAAVAGFRQAITIQEPLVRKNPRLAEYRREMGNSYGNLGLALSRLNRLSDAEAAYRKVLEIDTQLAAELQEAPDYLLRQGAGEGNLAELLARAGKPEQALPLYDAALEHLRHAAAQIPAGSSPAEEWLFNTTRGRARTLEQLQQFDESAQAWNDAVQLAPADSRRNTRLHQALALVQAGDITNGLQIANAESSAVESAPEARPTGLGPDALTQGEDELCAAQVFARAMEMLPEAADALGDQAIDCLRQAAELGYFHTAQHAHELQRDDHLAALRERPDFQKWAQGLVSK